MAQQEILSSPSSIRTATVQVGRFPGKLAFYMLYDGKCTIKGALEEAGIAGVLEKDIRLNGRETTFDDPVTDNDTVAVVEKIRGN